MSYPTFIIKEYLKNNYFPGSSAGEESTCNAGDPGSIPGSGISFGVGSHSSFLGLPWWLRWQRILLQYGRPGFDPWVGKIPWRREQLPTPVFLPGEFHGQRSLAGYSSWGFKESDMTVQLSPSLRFVPEQGKKGKMGVQETVGHTQ